MTENLLVTLIITILNYKCTKIMQKFKLLFSFYRHNFKMESTYDFLFGGIRTTGRANLHYANVKSKLK